MNSMNEKDFDKLVDVIRDVRKLLSEAKSLNYESRYVHAIDFLNSKVNSLYNEMMFSRMDVASSRRIKSARFIVEDEYGEVIGSADTYEEAETMGGAKIIDGEKIQSKRFVKSEYKNSRYIILMYDDIGGDGYKPGYYVWDKNDDVFMGDGAGGTFYSSYEEASEDLNRANSTIEDDGFEAKIVEIKSKDEYENLFSSKNNQIISSVEKAVSEAEDYFGTIASDDTVSSQDVITRKDSLEMKKIADRNGVKVKIGRFSVSFHDDDFGKFSDMIHRD